MEYTVHKLAQLAGISARTLRFYDEIDLLKPARISSAGYRIYGQAQVDTLQQILFFRALGLSLDAIAAILHDPSFDRRAALEGHLQALQAQKAQLDLLIETVTKTIQSEEGGKAMTDKEKFEGFKQSMVEENEARYGAEIREKYGAEAVEESNRKMLKMDKATYDAMQQAAADLAAKLAEAVTSQASAEDALGKEIALLHKAWLGYTWTSYSKEAHLGLVQMYLADERFTAYYDAQLPGCAQFLNDAVTAWQAAL